MPVTGWFIMLASLHAHGQLAQTPQVRHINTVRTGDTEASPGLATNSTTHSGLAEGSLWEGKL